MLGRKLHCINGAVSLGKAIEQRPGRPSSISTKKIKTVKELLDSDRGRLLDSDRRMTIRDITIRTGNTFGTVFRNIHNELCMRRICARNHT